MTKTYAQPFDPPAASAADLRKLAELIKDVRVAMLVTIVEDGRGIAGATLAANHPGLRARPMYTYKVDPDTFDGLLYFMTDIDTPKVREIDTDRHVLITYADASHNRYVAVAGDAAVEKNTAKIEELWNVHAKGWWPGGPSDPNVALIRVRVHAAEYWDGPSNTQYMFALARAVMTGDKIQPGGTHKTIEM